MHRHGDIYRGGSIEEIFWKVGGTGDGGRDEEIPEEGDEREAIRNAVRLTMAGE